MFKFIVRINFVLILAALLLVSCHKKEEPLVNEGRLEEVCRQMKEIQEGISEWYLESESPSDLLQHLDEIKSFEGVKDVYSDALNVYIDLDFGGSISYYFPLDHLESFDDSDYISSLAALNTRSGDLDISRSFTTEGNPVKICLANQQSKDEGRKLYVDMVNCLEELFASRGFIVEIENSPKVSFFKDEMQDYDIVFYITHGGYQSNNGVHWLLTSERALFGDNDLAHLVSQAKGYVSIGHIPEIRDGKEKDIAYYKINENYLLNQSEEFRTKQSIFFNTACESLKGSTDLAEAFIDRGLGLYFGYDETNSTGQLGGMYYLARLLSGFSYETAYTSLPDYLLHSEEEATPEEIKKYGFESSSWVANLLHVPEAIDSELGNKILTKPYLTDYEDLSSSNQIKFVLRASSSFCYPLYFQSLSIGQTYKVPLSNDPFTFGFIVSETSDISQGTIIPGIKIGEKGCTTHYPNYTVDFEQTLDNDILNSDTHYYYWAYQFDGLHYNLSEVSGFSTRRINQVIPEEILDQMDDYIPIYDGWNPPNVEGQYLVSPLAITYDGTNQYEIGDVFTDLYCQFLNQDMVHNTLDYQEKTGGSTSTGTGAFISGEGNRFSVFFNTEGVSVYSDYSINIKTALVISGIMTSEGIKDVYYAFVLVDKSDDPSHHIIDIGGFRVFKDSDGLSVPVNYFNSSSKSQTKGLLYNPSSLPRILDAVSR